MFVEITGTGFTNKGAELMLAAAAEACIRHGAVPVVTPTQGSYSERARLGLWQKAAFTRFKVPWHMAARILPDRMLKMYGVVTDREITAVVDASGFRFGDQWGTRECALASRRYHEMRRQGKRVILLPQAFGPFSNDAIRSEMRGILSAASAVYARDSESEAHLRSLAFKQERIRRRPDFTNIVHAEPANLPAPKKSVAILPNKQMFTRGSKRAAGRYLSFLELSIETAIALELKPVLVVHELETDHEVIEKLGRSARGKADIVKLSRAQELKWYLGQCVLVVGSRFHALASALSQGVPVIATGWSHKYRWLLDDYGASSSLLDLENDGWRVLLPRLMEPTAIERARSDLAPHLAPLREETKQLWSEVFEILRSEG